MPNSYSSPCGRLVLLLLLGFFAPNITKAQNNSSEQSPGQQPFQLQVQSNLVLVRVVVRDKNGQPVRGLKKDDFRLSDDGKQQTISQFEEVPSEASPVAPAAASSTPIPAAPSTAPQQRYIAFYFDELNSSEADLLQARDAADHFLATGLQPNDHVAIFTAEKMLSDFTSDPKKLHDALMQLHASTRGSANEHLCPDLSDYQAYQILQTNDVESDAWRVAIAEARLCPVTAFAGPSISTNPDSASLQPIRMLAQRIVDQAQSLTRTNLEQFEKVVKSIAQAPGQRSVVLVSPGFLSQSEQYALDRIIDRALRDQVVINSLDPKGLALLMRESHASSNATILPDPRASLARYHLDASKEFVGADVLAEVAEGTGGQFFHNENDLKAGFAAFIADAPHYILAFSPQKVKWDGKLHALKVRFARKEKGLTIQARRGYFAIQGSALPSQASAANAPPAPSPAPPTAKAASTPPPSPPAEMNTAGNVPQPPSPVPALGSSAKDSSDSQGNNPVRTTTPPALVPPASPVAGVAIAENGRRGIRMPDPNQGLIRIDVTVTDDHGKPVSGLSERDFSLLDNDQPGKIVTFQPFDSAGAQPANSHEVVLVIDELNMLPDLHNGKKEVDDAYREVENFLRADKGALQQPVMIYRLAPDGLYALLHTSLDGNELAEEIKDRNDEYRIWAASDIRKEIENINKGGDVSVRISQSLIALGSMSIEERRRPGRKLMFWLGIGWQIKGRRAEGLAAFSTELMTRLREARISLWGASEWPLYDQFGNAVPVSDNAFKQFLGGPKADSIDLSYLSLPVIAARTGGGMLDAPRDLASKIREQVEEEGSYYSLTFDPPRTSAIDEYHHLRLKTLKHDLTTHLFEDYYDEPAFYDQPPLKRSVTVKELQEVIANSHDSSGSDLAQQLQGMQLTERLSSAKASALEKQLHGKKQQEALQVLAIESQFLAPPGDETPNIPRPDMVTQRQIASRIVSYVNNEIPRLPNLFATRTTVQYHEPTAEPGQSWKTAFPDQSLEEGETQRASIRFHDGKERVQETSLKHVSNKPGSEHLDTVGTFGPILSTVMAAVALPGSELSWSRWEKSANGELAVFRYRVPRQTPYFSAEFCCLAYDSDAVPFKETAPFHGEIAVNPSTGAIMRLTIQADLPWRLPLHRSDVMVEYEPIARGPRVFICPSRSVSLSRQRRTMSIDEWGESFRIYGPFETLLNEMRFDKYRIFGSTSRILPDYVEVPDKKQ